jgi:hypothetical protein
MCRLKTHVPTTALKRMCWLFFFSQDRLGPKRMQKALKAMEVWERAGYLLAAGAGDAQKMQVCA